MKKYIIEENKEVKGGRKNEIGESN